MDNLELVNRLRSSGFFLLSEPLQDGVISAACGAAKCLEMHANSKADTRESLMRRDTKNDLLHLDDHVGVLHPLSDSEVWKIDDESGLPHLYHASARIALIHAQKECEK